MSEKIKCEVIQDLLPLYVDGLTSSETKEGIEEHVKDCERCHLIYSDMNSALGTENHWNKSKEIDYLKKIRKSSVRKYFFGILSALLIIIIAVFIKFFIIGTPTNHFFINTEFNEDRLIIKGEILDSGKAYTGHKLQGSGDNKNIIIYSGLVSPFKKSGSFEIEILSKDMDSYVSIGEKKVKYDGKVINSLAVRLFESKNPYIGNMSGNGRISNLLMISDKLGEYQNFLKTNEEPYSWKFIFSKELKAGEEEFFNSKMRSYAFVLLALVDNLSIVEWEYEVSFPEKNEQKNYAITKEDVSNVLGKNIKDYSTSYEEIQELLNFVGLD